MATGDGKRVHNSCRRAQQPEMVHERRRGTLQGLQLTGKATRGLTLCSAEQLIFKEQGLF